jgi:hypothetical protein
MGHYANKCPKAEKNPTTNTAPSTDCWKHQLPLSGDANTKTVNGTEYHWCSKCRNGVGCCSTTHGTAAHTAGFKKPPATGTTTTTQVEANVFETSAPRGLSLQYEDPEAYLSEAYYLYYSCMVFTYYLSIVSTVMNKFVCMVVFWSQIVTYGIQW